MWCLSMEERGERGSTLPLIVLSYTAGEEVEIDLAVQLLEEQERIPVPAWNRCDARSGGIGSGDGGGIGRTSILLGERREVVAEGLALGDIVSWDVGPAGRRMGRDSILNTISRELARR